MGIKIEEEWRHNKIKSEVASRSAFAFKIKRQIKQKEEAQSSYGFGKVKPLSREVVIKITGGAWSKKGIKNTVEYISKGWEEEVIDSNGIVYKQDKEIQDAVKTLQDNAVISVKADPTKKEKLTHNMMFSAPEIAGVKREDVLKATAEALKEKYPDNYFVMTYHNEEKNPHVHVIINIHKDNGEKIDIKNKAYHELRKDFCKNLVEYGYEVKASRRYENNKFSLKPSDYHELSQSEHTLKEYKNTYEVMDFGTELYQMDDKKSENNFLMYKTANGKEVIIWGKTLLDEIQAKGIKRGDFINIDKTGKEKIKVPVFDKDGETIVDWKPAKRNTWNIDKVGSEQERKFIDHVKTKQESDQYLKEEKEVSLEAKQNSKLNVEQNATPKYPKIKQKHVKVIKLNSSSQAAKHKVQRQKFAHEKKLTLDPGYKQEFEQQQKLELQRKQKHSYRF